MKDKLNFCYWRVDVPYQLPKNFAQKICLLRQNEYRILDEAKKFKEKGKINIFCPYISAEQAQKCEDYMLIKDIDG